MTNKLFAITTCILFSSLLLGSQTLSMSLQNAYAVSGGPVVLMGIDAEDGSPGNAHGPQATYNTVGGSILASVTNGGSGILVFGCTPAGGDHVTFFWNAVAVANGQTLTCVEGAANIAAQSLAGFALVGVASSVFQTPFGGLTQAENDALALKQTDIANHVNNGGGLWGLSQAGMSNPYAYIAGLGAFTVTINQNYDNISATPAGTALGINDSLDVFAWHDVYDTFPSFLSVLATIDCSPGSSCTTFSLDGRAAAIGGQQVIIEGEGCTPGFWKNNSSKHEASAWMTYAPSDDFDATFGVDITINWSAKGKPQNTDDFTLQQALEANGGNLNALARHGTAALLNAANTNIGGLTEAQVIQKVQDAVAAFNADDLTTFNDILDELTDKNEQVCTINQQGELASP